MPGQPDKAVHNPRHNQAVHNQAVHNQAGDGAVQISVDIVEGAVAVVEVRRPPNNFLDLPMIAALADNYERLDQDERVRAILLCSQGRHFCAGGNFGADRSEVTRTWEAGAHTVYHSAIRLFRAKTPTVVAVQGAAVGGGLGLALSADFRVASAESRFTANFARLGLHHGFGITVTLPEIVGTQRARDMLLTARDVRGEEAYRIGLCDRLVAADQIRTEALNLARALAANAPLAERSIRDTVRAGLADRVAEATEHELAEQNRLRTTEDFAEGLQASTERRPPIFRGR